MPSVTSGWIAHPTACSLTTSSPSLNSSQMDDRRMEVIQAGDRRTVSQAQRAQLRLVDAARLCEPLSNLLLHHLWRPHCHAFRSCMVTILHLTQQVLN